MGSGASEPASEAKAICKAALGRKEGVGVACVEEQLLKAFRKWDSNGDGSISVVELGAIGKKLGLADASVKNLMKDADVNKDGELSYSEFVSWLFQAPYLKKYFQVLEDSIFKAEDEYKALLKKFNGTEDYKKKEVLSAKMNDLEVKTKTDLKKELEPLLRQSFQWHDKDGNGVLDRGESVIFFSNYVSLLIIFIQHILKRYPDPAAPEDQMKKLYHYLRSDERHDQAFSMIDVKGKRSLEEEDVVEFLLPTTRKYSDVIDALLSATELKIKLTAWSWILP